MRFSVRLVNRYRGCGHHEEEGVPKEDNSVGKSRFLSFGDLQVVETLTGYSDTVRSFDHRSASTPKIELWACRSTSTATPW